jgi:hypothetical protein
MAVSDHTLNMIMASAAIVTVIVTVIVFWLQRKRKRLTYKVTSDLDLLTKNEQIRGQVKVLYADKPVENVRLYTIQVINSGRLVIERTDFDGPLHIEFDNNAQILSVEVIDTIPDDLPAEIEQKPNSIAISPLLMNRKDSITIKFILNGHFIPYVHARIKDVPKIKIRRYPQRYVSEWSMICLAITLILGFLSYLLKNKVLDIISLFFASMMGTSLATDLVNYITWRNSDRKKRRQTQA